jgi:plastocyanin
MKPPIAPGPRAAALLLVAGAVALCALPAGAATLQVTVTTPDGKPAADVAVLVQPRGGGVSPSTTPAQPTVIVQDQFRFLPFVAVVPVGGTVRFVNRDRVDHHVRSQPAGPLGNIPAAKDFEFRLGPFRAGREAPSGEVKFEQPGLVGVGCHIHGSMRGHIYVSPTPYFAVTNEQGVAVVQNVPDGPVAFELWHPDQLSEQPSLQTTATGSVAVQAKLNFTPRRRPPPRPPAAGDTYTY